jgi:hypothetical protein
MLRSSQEVTLGLLANITCLLHACTVLNTSAIFLNASWKSHSVRVFNTAGNSASITSIVSKLKPFSFFFSWGNSNVGWVEDDRHVIFGQKFTGEKGIVRQCVVLIKQPVILLPKFGEKSSHIFKQSL